MMGAKSLEAVFAAGTDIVHVKKCLDKTTLVGRDCDGRQLAAALAEFEVTAGKPKTPITSPPKTM